MSRLLLAGSFALTLPGIYLHFVHVELSAPVEALLFGLAVLGAAFLLAWAAEVAQLEISQALAVAILALIAVLPEYAVDLYFAWKAAENPEYAHYALANMTGANRLLVGLGWPLIVLIVWLRFRDKSVTLDRGQATEVSYLGIACLYAFIIPLKGQLGPIDTVVLLTIFAGYVWQTTKAEHHHPELVGPAAWLGELPDRPRKITTVALFLFSGAVILLVAEPFAESLIDASEPLGIPRFLAVQWLAPIASEAPEFIIASIWAFRGDPQGGLGALVSSKVNQWTLLVGTIPLVYSISAGEIAALPLDTFQQHELWLTAAQALFAVAVITNLDLDVLEATLLFALFAVQLVFPDTRIEVTIVYAAFIIFYLVRHRHDLPPLIRRGLVGQSMPARGD